MEQPRGTGRVRRRGREGVGVDFIADFFFCKRTKNFGSVCLFRVSYERNTEEENNGYVALKMK
jgi:hypothetical protein